MRYLVAGLVLGVGISSASADPLPEHLYGWRAPSTSGTYLEVGTGFMSADRLGVTYHAEYLRFAPQVSINRWIYVGAGFQIGGIYKAIGAADAMFPVTCSEGASGRECIPDPQGIDESSGTLTEGQLLVGIRDRIGIVSGGFELAPTLRRTTASTNTLNEAFSTDSTTIEVHARADVWATPHFNAGIMVGADTSSRHDLMAGLQLGFHFEPYDDMNR